MQYLKLGGHISNTKAKQKNNNPEDFNIIKTKTEKNSKCLSLINVNGKEDNSKNKKEKEEKNE